VESNYEDRSLFIESLDMIRENDRFFNSVLKKVHSKVALSEATQKNTVYLQEFSFTEMIKNIIDFFIDAVKNLWAKFKNLFHKITYSDKTIEKYADRLKDMKGDFTVTFPRYIYTCFDEDIPSINLKNTFYDDYSILEGKIKEIADLKTKTERCEKFRALEADVKAEVSPAYYDTLRSKTIGTTYMITSSYYASELVNKFRDGGKETTSKIDPTEVTNTLNRYQNNKTLIKQLEKAKTDTINAAKDIRKKIESIALQNVNKYYTPYDAEEETLFNKILQTKSGQVNEVCNIYVMAFSAKLDAAKESAIQDKKVLFEAIKFINSDFGR
jgi:hypothetical protein